MRDNPSFRLEVLQDFAACAFHPAAKKGEVIWVHKAADAQHLIVNGIARYYGAPLTTAQDPDALLARPDGYPIDPYSIVRKRWAGETVACIGGGPSLTQQQVDALRGRVRVITANNSYLLAPWADLLYFADRAWWNWHREREEFKKFAQQKCTIFGYGNAAEDPSIHILRNAGLKGLSLEPNAVMTGMNSGYQIINIAVLSGAKRILLLGYDMHFPGGKSHWHGGHPTQVTEECYKSYAAVFPSMIPQLGALGVEVLNCTPNSALNCFKRSYLESVLSSEKATVVSA